MRVFISWSGEASHKAAQALYKWLPVMLQSIRPFLSSDDLRKGGRWNAELAVELENTNYGIICVTPSNREAPWLLFESGALSKVVKDSHVSPLLLGVKPSELPSPLTQFNAATVERDDFWRLVKSINDLREADAMDEGLLKRSFDASWPSLSAELNESIEESIVRAPIQKKAETDLGRFDAILQELLVLNRSQSQILGSPQQLFPLEELADAIQRHKKMESSSDEIIAWREVIGRLLDLRNQINEIADIPDKLPIAFLRLDRAIEAVMPAYVSQRRRPGRPRSGLMPRYAGERPAGDEVSTSSGPLPNPYE